ncbi:MAG: hypothetical protein ACH0QD_02615 [Tepidibacillus sp.]
MKKILFLLGLAFLIAITPSAVFAHDQGYSSVDGSEIRWGDAKGTTGWTVTRDHSITKWNDMGIINIAPDSAWVIEDLSFTDVNRDDVTWSGQYSWWSNDSDLIKYNDYYFYDFSPEQRKHTALHELGHTLGIDHHDLVDNVMRSGFHSYTELGTHDKEDYNSLWGN